MSYIIDQDVHLARRRSASTVLKAFFGFALLAVVLLNVVFGTNGTPVSEPLQLAVAFAGGVTGVFVSFCLSRRSSHKR